jgi:hypothetical protein
VEYVLYAGARLQRRGELTPFLEFSNSLTLEYNIGRAVLCFTSSSLGGVGHSGFGF